MKALQVIRPREFIQVEIPIPDLRVAGLDRILVRPSWVSMCGSDIPFFTGSKRHRTYPLAVAAPIHECMAIKMFLAALRNPLYRTPERSWLNAGICAAQRNDFAAADEFFQQALKLLPDNARALYELANLAYRRVDYVGARTHLNRLARNSKPNAEVLWLAVRTERQLGDREAEASYGLQLRRNFPDSKEAQALAAGRYE